MLKPLFWVLHFIMLCWVVMLNIVMLNVMVPLYWWVKLNFKSKKMRTYFGVAKIRFGLNVIPFLVFIGSAMYLIAKFKSRKEWRKQFSPQTGSAWGCIFSQRDVHQQTCLIIFLEFYHCLQCHPIKTFFAMSFNRNLFCNVMQ